MSSVVDAVVVFLGVVVGLFVIEAYVARRREKRILSETNASMLEVRGHSDAQINETRKRTDAYQSRIFALMEEHNALLREILGELRSRDSSSQTESGS